MNNFTLHLGDCLDSLRGMADNSVDSIVTDPPYGLSFMGKKWDYDVPSEAIWRECLRVLKPGGHLLAFAGTRTQHRMAVRIEDAGFEIRDMIFWCYGSGFPKSHDVSKAIDKVNGDGERLLKFTRWMRTTGLTAKQVNEATGTFMGSHYLTDKTQPAIPTSDLWRKLRPLCGEVPAWVDQLVERIEAEREVLGIETRYNEASGIVAAGRNERTLIERSITAPATEAAKQWQGWGSALKPSLEPVTVARKPLIGTLAANVLEHGTGGLNIDGCRVAGEHTYTPRLTANANMNDDGWQKIGQAAEPVTAAGRWPANLIHDGSEEVLAGFPETGPSKAAARGGSNPNPMDWGNVRSDGGVIKGHDDNGGSAARFFKQVSHDTEDMETAKRFMYCAKASKRDRDEGLEGFEEKNPWDRQSVTKAMEGLGSKSGPRKNVHPTVKPTDLMAYLCRLVTPPGGVVLDPFMGSGSTGKAAMLEGFQFIGCEMSPEYLEIARARIQHEVDKRDPAPATPAPQLDLFSAA